MINVAILKQDFIINRKPILIVYLFQAVSLLLAVAIRSLRLNEISDAFWDTFPTVVIPMGMLICLAFSLVKQRVDDKTMDFLLAADVRPAEIILTKTLFLVFNLFILMTVSMVFGIVTHVYDLTGEWTQDTFILLYLGGFCLQVFMAGYCFFISCAGCDRKESFYWKAAAGVLIAEYLLYLACEMFPQAEMLQYATIFSMFRQGRFARGDAISILFSLILAVAGVLLFAGARYSFCRQDGDE